MELPLKSLYDTLLGFHAEIPPQHVGGIYGPLLPMLMGQAAIPQIEAINRYGILSDIDNTQIKTLWEGSTVYNFPTAAGILTVSSSSANDVAAGTGARTIHILGLNADLEEIEEVIALASPSATTVNSFYRVITATVITAGSAGQNLGTITISRAGNPLAYIGVSVFGAITVGRNRSLMATYTIPKGYSGILSSLGGQSRDNAVVYAKLRIKPPTTGLAYSYPVLYLTSGDTQHKLDGGYALPEGTDISMEACNSVANNARVSGFFCIWQIKHPE